MAQWHLRVGGLATHSSSKWLQSICGMAALRALQIPNGSKASAGWRPAAHSSNYQMAPKHLRGGSPQSNISTEWLQSSCRLFARHQMIPKHLPEHLRIGRPQHLPVPKWLQGSCGWVACEALQEQPAGHVLAGRLPAGHYKHQMTPKHLRLGGQQGIEWFQRSLDRKALEAVLPNGSKIPAAGLASTN